MLAHGKSSRLYRALVEEQQVAQSVTAWQYPLTHGSVFGIEVLGKPDQDPDALEAAAWEVLTGLGQEGPTQAELDRARRSWQAETLRGLEQIGGFGGKADVLNYYNYHTGDPGFLTRDFARFDAVTAESVQATLAAQVRADNRVVVQVRPATHGGAQ